MAEPSATPTQVVEAFLDAFIALDLDTAVTYIADACEYTNIPMGTVRGPAGVHEVLEPFVFMERLDRHRLDHGWRELPVNSVFEVQDGQITVWRDYFDLGTAAKIHDPAAD